MTAASGFAVQVAATLTEGRALAEARMDSVGRIFYATGRGALNATTKKQDPTYADRITAVPCRIAAPRGSAGGNETSPAQTIGSKLTREVSIPASSVEVHVGDFLELTTVGPLTDPSLAGLRWRVVDPGMASQTTARRMLVEVDR